MGILEQAIIRRIREKYREAKKEDELRDRVAEIMEKSGIYYWDCPRCHHRNTYSEKECLNCKAARVVSPEILKKAKVKEVKHSAEYYKEEEIYKATVERLNRDRSQNDGK